MPHYDEDYEDDADTDTDEKNDDAVKSARISSLKQKGMSERDATVKGLVSMKKPSKEKAKEKDKDKDTPFSTFPTEEKYSYGLQLRLEDEELAKLGIESLPDVGTKVEVAAKGSVRSVSSNQYEDGEKKRRSVEIQITDLNIT